MSNNQSVLAKVSFNSGATTHTSFATVEDAILSYRKARKAHRIAQRACGFTYSIDGGASWLN